MLLIHTRYHDESREVLQMMERMGGVDAVLRDQDMLAKIAGKLGAGEQLVLRKVSGS